MKLHLLLQQQFCCDLSKRTPYTTPALNVIHVNIHAQVIMRLAKLGKDVAKVRLACHPHR